MARVEDDERDMIYRIYVTEGLRAVSGIEARYCDFISETPVETRTGEEIINNIKDKINNLE